MLDESGRCRDGFSMEICVFLEKLLQDVFCQTGSFSDFTIHGTAPGSFIYFFAKYDSLQLLLKFDSYAFPSMHKMHEVHAGKELHEQNLCGSTYLKTN